jgi:hypothetical protein
VDRKNLIGGLILTFVIFSSVTILFLLFFVTQPKRLHTFEILFIWFLLIFIYENFLAYFTLNAKVLVFSEKPQMVASIVVSRLFLTPAIIIWSIGLIKTLHTWWKKGTFVLIIVSVLVGIEYLAQWLGVLKLENWTLWWSFAEWGFIFLMAIWIQKRFHIILIKEGKI